MEQEGKDGGGGGGEKNKQTQPQPKSPPPPLSPTQPQPHQPQSPPPSPLQPEPDPDPDMFSPIRDGSQLRPQSPVLYVSPIEPQYSRPQSSPPLPPIITPSVARTIQQELAMRDASSSSSSSFSIPPSASAEANRRMSDLFMRSGEPATSEEIFNMYLLDYLKKKGMHNSAEIFRQQPGVRTDPIKIGVRPDGFLVHLWSTMFDPEEKGNEISKSRRMSELLISGEPATPEEIFNMYLLDYMKKKGMHNSAEIFQQEAGVRTDPIKIDEQPDGFLLHLWSTVVSCREPDQ